MISATRRLVACMTLLLPFEAIGGDSPARAVPRAAATHGECDHASRPCKAPHQPGWKVLLDGYGMQLPKLQQMPSACRQPRQYRTYQLDKLQRQPCYYA